MFCCVRGEHLDGHDFARGRRRRRARPRCWSTMSCRSARRRRWSTADTRAATGWLAAAVHDHPCDSMTMVGVTGTNGKTTTAQLIGDRAARRRPTRRGARHAVGRAHHTGGTRSATPARRSGAMRASTPSRWRCRRTRSRWTASPARASTSPCSPTSAATTSICTARSSGTSPPRRCCSSRASPIWAWSTPTTCTAGCCSTSASIPLIGFSLDDVSDLEVHQTYHSYTLAGRPDLRSASAARSTR